MSAILIDFHKQQTRLSRLKQQQQQHEAEAKFFADLLKEAMNEALTPTDVICAVLEEKGIVFYSVGCAVAHPEKITHTVKIDGVNTEVCLCLKTGELLFDGQSAPLKSFFS